MVRVAGKDRAASIGGGFVLVPVAPLMAAWRACRTRPLGVGDFRTWLAAHEMRERRCGMQEGRAPTYSVAELAGLLGVTDRRARASVKRLVAAGLLEWSDSAIAFPDPRVEDAGLEDTIGRGKGSLAIPRRILRLLSGGARPALIATALGILLRCLSRRRGGFDGRGRVKASWIATTFGVDLRRVKAARVELVTLGWIEPEPSDQRAENRWGRAYRIDLACDRAGSRGRSLPPLPPADRPATATPSVNREPLPERGERNQEPAGRGPAGVELEGSGDGERPLPDPDLRDVRSRDLADTGRTLKLFEQAADRGVVGRSEADRLRFVALAGACRAFGAGNTGGLFAALLRRNAWAFISQAEEDVARRRLREHLHGRTRPPEGRRSSFDPEGTATPRSLGDVMAGLLASLQTTR